MKTLLSHFKQNDIPQKENPLVKLPFIFPFDNFYFPKDLKISLSNVAKVDLYPRFHDKFSVNSGPRETASVSIRKKLKVRSFFFF